MPDAGAVSASSIMTVACVCNTNVHIDNLGRHLRDFCHYHLDSRNRQAKVEITNRYNRFYTWKKSFERGEIDREELQEKFDEIFQVDTLEIKNSLRPVKSS